MLDVAEAIVNSALRARGIARRAPAHRLPRARRRAIPGALAGRPRQPDGSSPGRVSAGDDHPLAAGRAGLREVADRWRDRITLQVARYRPEEESEATLPGVRGAVSEGLGGPRRAQLHQGPTGRHAVVPLVVPDGRLRQLRHDRQRRAEADLRHVPRRLRARAGARRAAAQLPGHPRPGRRDRRLHAQAARASSPGSSARRRSRCRRANTCRRRRSWTTTSSSACASTACCAMRPARSTGWIRSSSARRPSRSRSATTSTRATRARRSACEMLSEHEGIWGCTFVGECTKVCPKHVDPAGAIQRYKLRCGARMAQVVRSCRGARDERATLRYTAYHPRWYPDAGVHLLVARTRGRTSLFILRELSSIFVGWFVVYLLLLVRAVSQGESPLPGSSWTGRGQPAVLALNVVSFLFVVLPRGHLVQPGAARRWSCAWAARACRDG